MKLETVLAVQQVLAGVGYAAVVSVGAAVVWRAYRVRHQRAVELTLLLGATVVLLAAATLALPQPVETALTLSADMAIFTAVSRLVSNRSWRHSIVLSVGAIVMALAAAEAVGALLV